MCSVLKTHQTWEEMQQGSVKSSLHRGRCARAQTGAKMAVAKRQGREKPAKIEQRKAKGRSEDQSEDFRRNKQHSWLSPVYMGQALVEEKT